MSCIVCFIFSGKIPHRKGIYNETCLKELMHDLEDSWKKRKVIKRMTHQDNTSINVSPHLAVLLSNIFSLTASLSSLFSSFEHSCSLWRSSKARWIKCSKINCKTSSWSRYCCWICYGEYMCEGMFFCFTGQQVIMLLWHEPVLLLEACGGAIKKTLKY